MLDKLDVKILAALQDDASRPVAEIADAVGLSKNACWRRIKALEDAGVVARGAALIDPSAVGLGVTVFVSLRTSHHDDAWLQRFLSGIKGMPEVVEVYRLSGEVDYLLKVLVSDIKDFDRVYKRLITAAPLTDVASSFAMETIKSTTALPLDRIPL